MFISKLELLPKELLVQTSSVDHADWNYRPLLGFLQRARFRLVGKLLKGLSCVDLLEVGYGSGVFFPHLKTVSERLSGIDPHTCEEQVRQALQRVGIEAELKSGSVANMPFAERSFDVIVAVSALEYVDAIDDACREMKRVLRPNGNLVVVTPCKSPILDCGLRIVGGEDAESNYGARREKLFSSLVRHFDIDAHAKWPWPGVPGITVYRALRLTPKTK